MKILELDGHTRTKFNDKMKELFSLVEKINEIEKSYYNSINKSNEKV